MGEDKRSRARKVLDDIGALFADEFGLEREDELHTSARVKHLAGKGEAGGDLSKEEISELCGSVMRHIERHQEG